MQRRYVTVDVFTDRIFGGNPLAVVLDAQGLNTAQMQAIATEFNYAETTFVLPPRAPDHSAHVRIFTPRTEVPFAGHPNVGTAVVFAHELEGKGGRPLGRLVFEEAAGPVPIRLIREQNRGKTRWRCHCRSHRRNRRAGHVGTDSSAIGPYSVIPS
jgi:trans-2,3-dihydro-3-hydroxyanthranilate isomerase